MKVTFVVNRIVERRWLPCQQCTGLRGVFAKRHPPRRLMRGRACASRGDEESCVEAVKGMNSPILLGISHANVDVLLLASSPTSAALILLSNADVLLGVRVLLVEAVTTFPSSALDSYSLVSLYLGGIRSLLVPVGRGKDAERDTVGVLVGQFL